MGVRRAERSSKTLVAAVFCFGVLNGQQTTEGMCSGSVCANAPGVSFASFEKRMGTGVKGWQEGSGDEVGAGGNMPYLPSYW